MRPGCAASAPGSSAVVTIAKVEHVSISVATTLERQAPPMDLLDTADRLFTGALPIEAHHPFPTSGELAEVQPRPRVRRRLRQLGGGRHRRRPGGRRHERRLPRQAGARDDAALVRAAGSTPRSSPTATSTTCSVSTCTRPRRATNGWAPPRVVAHELVPERFDRYVLTAGYNAVINQRQFKAPGLRWPIEYRYPDETYRRHARRSTSAASAFELHHARGETDDGTWVWAPARQGRCSRATCSSGRRRTAATRRRCSATRATGRSRSARWPRSTPRCCCPVTACRSSAPIACARRSTDGAELLETLLEQTLALMNEGARLDDIVHTVRRARAPARAAVPPADLRRARVRRAQHLALLRRLVRRRPVAPEAGARGRARSRARRRSPAAPRQPRRPRARARGRRRPPPRRPSRRARRAGRTGRQRRARGARRGVRTRAPGRRRRRCRRASSRGPSTSRTEKQHDEARGLARSSSPARRPASAPRSRRSSPSGARPSASSPGAPTGCATCSTQCREHTPDSQMWTADLGDLERAEQVALEAWDAFGGLDALVNNAAIPEAHARHRSRPRPMSSTSWTSTSTPPSA